ncbi:PepSY domain-containing protein [Rhodobacter maris]|uniref:Peptidase YpeB-like protein n=1 Tax=Rhodobacter maris TaxID=446682 RepID=A0A285TLJ3_9RHOB|nr:PepSY domain-containing protein [Rhodobacter maris]SOC21586.1 peptidase YpeB-like protein [Rhodobacter maris]
MKRTIALSLIPVTLAAGVAGAAWAGTNGAGTEMSDAQEVQAAMQSGMTLTQAVDTAQKQTGGTALSAGWENNDNGSWGYEVEIADAASTMQTWFVNPADGTVTKVMETQDDHEQSGAQDEQGESGEQDDND